MNPLLYFGAIFAGTVYGLAFDPMAILVGLILGAASSKWWHAALGAIALAIVLTFAVRLTSEFSGGMPIWWISICRSVAILGWAVPILVARWLVRRAHPVQSSSGSA